MRVTIWVDMEGISGIMVWEQVNGGAPMYEEGRRLLTEEVNAAVRGARRGGATEVVVLDCHGAGGPWSFKSLLMERLDPGAEYVLGSTWTRYREPLEQGCDAALFVGFHAMAGTPDGILSHTVSAEAWYNAWINDTLVGESGICAAILGEYGVPVLMVAGDEATCREATALLGDGLVTAPVKKGIGRMAARNLAPSAAHALIEERAATALQDLKRVAPYRAARPAAFTVELSSPEKGNPFRGLPGVEFEGPRKVVSRAPTFLQAWDQFWHY